MVDKAEFVARLDGSLEEKLRQAYTDGFTAGHQFGWEFKPIKLPTGLENWMIDVDYREWQRNNN